MHNPSNKNQSMKVTLYKKSKIGKLQKWSIEATDGAFRTIEGYVDGAMTPTEWTRCIGKRKGASNETTAEEQAVKEAEAKVTKQKNKGWTEKVEDIEAVKISPMLAHKWNDYKDKVSEEEQLASQPKLDGIRCVATEEGLFTRTGKPIHTAPHILEEVKVLFRQITPFKGYIDGELYNHKLKEDFNKITSLVRKQNPNGEELELSRTMLQFHIYDFDLKNTTFEERYGYLRLAFITRSFNYLKLVPTTFITLKELGQDNVTPLLDYLYGQYLKVGFEGQIIRFANSLYENSRSKSLLKRKEFIDEEFEILDIIEGTGNRSGMMGNIHFRLKWINKMENLYETFDSNARGTFDYFKELLANKQKYIGKIATVRYQNLTPDGIPRFPVMIDIRDYE